jgi:ATP-dependent Clp protease ATP-binding subunit ClpX
VVSIDALDTDALVRILTEPRNALVKQYQQLLAMDDVTLKFEPAALLAAAELSIKRDTGARGLRSIIEQTLLDVMYEIPGRSDVRTVVITPEAISGAARPRLLGEGGAVIEWEHRALPASPAKPTDENKSELPAA